MSIFRHLPLWACLPVLSLACASQPVLAARPLLTPGQPDSASVSLASGTGAPEHTANAAPPRKAPYAPTRSADAALYFWRNDKPTECESEPRSDASDEERSPAPPAARALLGAVPERTSDEGSDPRSVSPEFVVAALRPALHHCFSRWLDDQLDAQGSARFALELDCAGEVAAISAENRGVDEGTLACLFSAMGPAHFAPPAAGHATVVVPVLFKNAR